MNQKIIPYNLMRSNIKNIYIQIKDGKVIVRAPRRFSEKQIDEIVRKKQNWIEKSLQKSQKRQERRAQYTQEEFIQIIEEDVKQLMQVTGLKPKRVRIKEITYAWGTCSSKQNITINQKLICYPKEVIRYVILHELAHLKYMNHSKEFWNLVETYMPEYKKIKKALKE